MTLKPPSYIPVEIISKAPIDYEWDAWDPYAPLGKQDEDTMDRLALLSYRAIIAYSIGCAEWVVYRLSRFFDDQTPYAFLEACWAFEMDKGFEAPSPLKAADWQGPVLGAVDLALVSILNTYYATDEGAPEVEAALGELIALHVLKDTEPFIVWRERILERLLQLYRCPVEDSWGRSVPREALDPNVQIDGADQDRLVKAFLNSLDFKENRFLKYTGGDNSA